MRKAVLLFTILCPLLTKAQQYKPETIPENLSAGAYAVIRYDECNFTQTSDSYAKERVTRVITILDEKGEDLGNVSISLDKFRKLKSFTGEIIFPDGKVFKKVSKSDLATTAYSEHLATDDYLTYYELNAPSYPVTFKYSYEIEWKNGIFTYPAFAPALPDASVEKSVHTIKIPEGCRLRYKDNECAPDPVKSIEGTDTIYTWKIENYPAVNIEPLAPPFYSITPLVYISPSKFIFDGEEGDLSTWQSTGIFLSRLMEKRDSLPDNIKEIIKGLVSNDKKETIRKIFEYLQNTTRYVSIQLGIGGYQPIEAYKVASKGYGDCKALTNYMKAMLSAAGIESVYSVVNTRKKDFFDDFSSLGIADHVILCVPEGKDTIWLECTSRVLPFNYVHSDIAGHEVLLVDGERSRLTRVREIEDSLNTENNFANITLARDGSINADLKTLLKNHPSESLLPFYENKSETERRDYLSENLNVPKPEITRIESDFKKGESPEIYVNYKVTSPLYGSKSGTRYFVPIDPFKSSFGRIFSSSQRKQDILISDAINQTDSITLTFPELMTPEAIPQDVSIKSKAGSFASEVTVEKNVLHYICKIVINPGRYPASDYTEIRSFLNQIDKNLKNKIVIKD
jgi:transglutaminase-like putative cysteine protease